MYFAPSEARKAKKSKFLDQVYFHLYQRDVTYKETHEDQTRKSSVTLLLVTNFSYLIFMFLMLPVAMFTQGISCYLAINHGCFIAQHMFLLPPKNLILHTYIYGGG